LAAVLADSALAGRLREASAAVAAEAGWGRGAAALGSLLSALATGRVVRSR